MYKRQEDEFTSEQTDNDFFSDEKEMPSVQEGDTRVENAGQGIDVYKRQHIQLL